MSIAVREYESYQATDVAWLPQVPSQWELLEAKRIFANRREPSSKADEQLAASQQFGVIPQSLMMKINDAKVMLALKGTETFRHVEIDDFVISLRSFEGGVEHSAYTGCVSPAYTVLSARKPIVAAYYRFLMKSAPFVMALQSTTDSLRDGKAISYSDFGSLRLPLPPLSEQKRIAEFLDYETAKIDALIEKQQQLIALLSEKRQAVISHAVTKGLNPNAPMRDSGVEWLGQVPEHWRVTRLKYLVRMTCGYAFKSEDFVEEGIQLIRIGNLYLNELRLDRSPSFLPLSFAERHREFIVTAGDLLMSLTGTLGKRDYGFAVLLRSAEKYLLNQRVACLNCRNVLNTKYAEHLLRSDEYVEQICRLPFGTKQANLSAEDVLAAWVPLPPIEEQTALLEFIEQRLNQFLMLEAKVNEQVELLQERRTALISAAVTGKIDVRGWKRPTADRPLNAEMELA